MLNIFAPRPKALFHLPHSNMFLVGRRKKHQVSPRRSPTSAPPHRSHSPSCPRRGRGGGGSRHSIFYMHRQSPFSFLTETHHSKSLSAPVYPPPTTPAHFLHPILLMPV